ncbi:MAG: hypothetical protein AABW59_04465 [archaeon]
MNKKIIFTLALMLIFFGIFANASYILQLRYENGQVIQEAVYPSNADATPSADDALELTLGNYSTTIGFPMLEAVDSPSGAAGVHEKSSPRIFVIVDEVPTGTTLAIQDVTGNVLLSEPLKQAVEEGEFSQAQTDLVQNDSSSGIGAIVGIIIMLIIAVVIVAIPVVVIGAVVFLFILKKKPKKK